MARWYLEEIRTIQPQGPYTLVGFSLGGLIAYEMAQQIRRARETIALLTVIDTRLEAPTLSLERLSRHGRSLLRQSPLKWPGYMASLLRNHFDARRREQSLQVRRDTDMAPVHQGAGANTAHPLPLKVLMSVRSSYRPKRYSGNLLLITAEDTYQGWRRGWRYWVRGSIHHHVAPGDHGTILSSEEGVTTIAAALSRYLTD
jgi:acetoacetyl-CoA synthetase